MSESYIPVEGQGKNLETAVFENTAGDTVHREGVFNGSPTNFDAKQEVDETPMAARVILYDIDGVPFSVANPVPIGGTIDEVANVTSVDTVDTLTAITNNVNVVNVDPDNPDAQAGVTDQAPQGTEYGLVTRPIMPTDAFARVRVSQPKTLFEATLQYGKYGTAYEEQITGSATSVHDPDSSCVNMTTTTASGDKVIRQTTQYLQYQPGKSHYILQTFDPVSQIANNRKRIGYFDAANGPFLEISGTEIAFTLRSSTSGTVSDSNRVTQANWSEDPLDGTGASGITLDLTKSQILFFDLEWLGTGTVRAGFVIDGNFIHAHHFHWANENNLVFMTTPNLPLRWEIENTGVTAEAATLRHICGSVMSEGGSDSVLAEPYSCNMGVTPKTVSTRVPVLSIRPALTFNSIVNRIGIKFDSADVLTETNDILVEIVHEGTLTGASFSAVNATESGVEFDTAATAISGGEVHSSFYIAAGSGKQATTGTKDIFGYIPITLDIDGANPKNLSIVCTGIGGNATVLASMGWQEQR